MIELEILRKYGATIRQAAPAEIIFSEAEECYCYYQVVAGRIKWVNIDEKGKEFIQGLVGDGESFGELPLFDGKPYAATAIAECETTLARLNKPAFFELIKDHPEILLDFTKLFIRRLRFKSSLLQSFATHTPESRIVNLINHLKSENKYFCPTCHQLELTRQQIADMTGLRVETVIRTIRAMHDRKELLITKGKIYCRNMIEITKW